MSARKTFLRWFGCASTLVLVSACVQNLFDPRTGKVEIDVQWPKAAPYRIQAIPQGTVRIDVTVLGEGLEAQPMTASITPNGTDNSTDFLEVPIGPKIVQATAYDAKNQAVASGETAVAVQPNALTEATIELQPGVSPQPTPTASGAAGSPGPGAPIAFTIATIAGDGQPGGVDAGNALAARFKYPQSLVYDPSNNAIYIADSANHAIRKFDLGSQAVTTLVGQLPGATPSPGATPIPDLLSSVVGSPAGLVVGPDKALYFADRDNNVIRRVGPGGALFTVAGTGQSGDAAEGTNQLAAAFNAPSAIAIDKAGAIYVADTYNHKVKRIANGIVTTVAGTGTPGFSGDSGAAGQADLSLPISLALAPDGSALYIGEGRSDSISTTGGLRVRRVDLTTNTITTVVGSGTNGTAGEGGPAVQAALNLPLALAFAPTGELLIADGWAYTGFAEAKNDLTAGIASRVVKLTIDGRLVRVAGNNVAAEGFSGDGDDALKAALNDPSGLALDSTGRIYVADTYNNRIRVLTPPSPTPTPIARPTASASATASPTATPTATPTLAPAAGASGATTVH